ncbi:MAG: hypothetical protein DME77_04860 [Verrucomicrobia bacterium]|nr:MAG: hypothetical protein DME77_04860 [Verrucomicrobiota bacterium]PYL13746.1 MAG: hypothetical protein DMF43_03925 [Verrucomicrobiota bacterium]
MWIKRDAAEADYEKGEDFSHKERVLSVIFEASASAFFQKKRNFLDGAASLAADSRLIRQLMPLPTAAGLER